MKNSIIALLICALLFAACSTRGETEANPAKLLGRTLILPTESWQKSCSIDSAVTLRQGLKILVYYNSRGCVSCRLKELEHWRELIGKVETLRREKQSEVDFIFLFRSEPNSRQVSEKLKEYEFDAPVYYDPNGSFEKTNVLPENDLYHAFLLNRNNQILLIGSPIFSPKLWDKYKNKITELSELYKTGF